jgi:hypothetical protein
MSNIISFISEVPPRIKKYILNSTQDENIIYIVQPRIRNYNYKA